MMMTEDIKSQFIINSEIRPQISNLKWSFPPDADQCCSVCSFLIVTEYLDVSFLTNALQQDWLREFCGVFFPGFIPVKYRILAGD